MIKKLTFVIGLLFCFCTVKSQIINDFEQGIGSLTVNAAIYKNQSANFNIMQCNVSPTIGNLFTPSTSINNYSAKNSLMTAVNDPILATYGIYIPVVSGSGGNYSLRLNNNTANADITSYTQTFMPTSKYISFDYLAVSKSPHTNPDEEDVQPFFTARLLDANNNIIQSLPLCIKAIFGDPILSNNNNDLFYTKGFYCQSLVIPEKYINKENIKIQFVIADCGLGGDIGMVYLDNIRLGEPCAYQPTGMLKLNPLIIECNPTSIKVTGTYTPPNGTIYVSSTLEILDSSQNSVTIPTGNIILNNFSNGIFSYTVILNPALPLGSYEIKVKALFKTPTGVPFYIEDISTNEGSDVSFQDSSPLNVTITHNEIEGLDNPSYWENVGGPYYVEYVINSWECCPGGTSSGDETNPQIYNFITYDNDINAAFGTMATNTARKCFRFRVRAECKEWSTWCCVTSYGWSEGGYKPNDPTQKFNICHEEIDLSEYPGYQNNLTAYPNPTTGFVSVLNSNTTVFDIYDLNQQKVKSVKINKVQEKVNIDLSELKKGIYILKTDNRKEIKIIKQ